MQAQPEVTVDATIPGSVVSLKNDNIPESKLSRTQKRRKDKLMRTASKVKYKQAQLHVFLSTPEVKMLNYISSVLDTDPRDFIRSVIPLHFEEIRKLQAEAKKKAEVAAVDDVIAENSELLDSLGDKDDESPAYLTNLIVGDTNA